MKVQWRRGLALATIHLAVCTPLIVWEEAHAWDWARSQEGLRPDAAPLVQPGDGEAVAFNPCRTWYRVSLPQRIIVLGEFPAAAVSRWREPCPPAWSLAGLVGMSWPNRDSRRKEIQSSIGLCSLIALQWILVGAFPLVHPRRWFWEPGPLITICTCTGILALLAPILWIIWLVLFAWKVLQCGYRGLDFAWQFFHHPAVGISAEK
jgi:hypothetical protein